LWSLYGMSPTMHGVCVGIFTLPMWIHSLPYPTALSSGG
jgi:hypothetical protein